MVFAIGLAYDTVFYFEAREESDWRLETLCSPLTVYTAALGKLGDDDIVGGNSQADNFFAK